MNKKNKCTIVFICTAKDDPESCEFFSQNDEYAFAKCIHLHPTSEQCENITAVDCVLELEFGLE